MYDKLENLQHSVVASRRDPAALSGGEKSLTTLCLLLSLWEVCGTPIRCLGLLLFLIELHLMC